MLSKLHLVMGTQPNQPRKDYNHADFSQYLRAIDDTQTLLLRRSVVLKLWRGLQCHNAISQTCQWAERLEKTQEMIFLPFRTAPAGFIVGPSFATILHLSAPTGFASSVFTSVEPVQLPFDPQDGTGAGTAYQFRDAIVHRCVGIAHLRH